MKKSYASQISFKQLNHMVMKIPTTKKSICDTRAKICTCGSTGDTLLQYKKLCIKTLVVGGTFT